MVLIASIESSCGTVTARESGSKKLACAFCETGPVGVYLEDLESNPITSRHSLHQSPDCRAPLLLDVLHEETLASGSKVLTKHQMI
jgi:hypothetical protein